MRRRKMKQAICLRTDGIFPQNLGGNVLIENDVTVVKAVCSAGKESVIASPAIGTKFKIRFFKILAQLRSAVVWYIARSQLGDPTEYFIRTKLGTWQCHADYIHETIQREKMRGYDFRTG